MTTPEQVTILIVDDDEIDVEAVRRALRRSRVTNPTLHAENGEIALDMLRGTNGRSAIPRPYLILLDLNMPRMNGLECLAHLRSDPAIADSIVFVLTTSDADRDRCAAYEKQVAGYVLKSSVGEGFVKLISMLEGYWRVVEFPTEAAS